MVLDIPNDSVFTHILESNILYDREYIFGPIFIRQFEKLALFYGFDKNKKLISPLSYMSVKNNYRNIYQTVPIPIAQIDALINFIVKSFNYEELIIIGQQKEDSLISYAKKKLSFLFKKGKCKIYTFENSQSIDRNFIKNKLKKEENFILVPSNDRSFVSRLLPTLASMEDTLFTVFGLNTWNRFDNLDYNDLVNLNVHLPSIFNNDDSTFYLEFR